MRMFWIAALVTIGLCGCAQNGYFTKPGGTDADFQSDKTACEYEALKYAGSSDPSLGAFGQALEAATRKNQLIKACLQQKGWSAK
ncbi:hypothetical protein GGR60_000904 [Xanthomonas arboricola]|nr:hypothetical protein [Xanthomonas euroxanthea]